MFPLRLLGFAHEHPITTGLHIMVQMAIGDSCSFGTAVVDVVVCIK